MFLLIPDLNMSKRKQNAKKLHEEKNKKIYLKPVNSISFYLGGPSTETTVQQPPSSSSSIAASPQNMMSLYKSTDLRTSFHGDIFQLRLLMLFLYRAEECYSNFFLATEMDVAQKFDDVVLRFQAKPGEWHWRFLQAKHTVNVAGNKITEKNLLTDKVSQPMALAKYLKSMIDIKSISTFGDSCLDSFILCANHDITSETANHLELSREQYDPILDFKNHLCKKYRLKPNSQLSSLYKQKYPNCEITFRKELIAAYGRAYGVEPNQDDVEDFFTKFRLVCRYPNKDNLMKFINKEMGDKIGFLNAELATSSFQDTLLEFMAEYKREGSRYLVVDDAKQFKEKLHKNMNTLMMTGLSKARPELLMNYKISFRATPQELTQFTESSDLEVFLIITESILLSAIKIGQFLKTNEMYKAHDSYIFLTLEMCHVQNIKELACSSFNSSTSHSLFVVEGQTEASIQDNDLYTQLECTLNFFNTDENVKKQVIFITNDETSETAISSKLQKVQDSISFTELDDRSQATMLDNMIVYQNKHLSLNQLMNIQAAQQLLDLDTIERLLLKKDIEVEAVRTNQFDGYDSNSYIRRTLSHQIVSWEALTENLPEIARVVIIGIDDDKLSDLLIENFPKKYKTKKTAKHNNIVTISEYNDLQIVLNKRKNESADTIVLEYANNDLFWIDFQGNPNEIYKYLKDFTPFNEIPEDEVASVSNLKKKINILVDNPGTGKSCLITHLADNLKQKNNLLWVVKVNLNDHAFDPESALSKDIKYISLHQVNFTENDTKEAVTFLMKMVYPKEEENDKTRFQQRFFVSALCYEDNECSYPKVAILFDGFDEISPIYRTQTLKLLKALSRSRAVCIWVTSRFQEKRTLEKELGSVAYHLNPFTRDQQKDYMNKVWSSKQDVKTDFNTFFDSINSIIQKKLIDHIHIDFTNVPLHLKMLTDVAIMSDTILHGDLGLYELYREFTQSKFNLFYESKRSIGATMGGVEVKQRDISIMTAKHGEIAFALFFPELLNKKLQSEIENDFTSLIRVGLLIPGGPLVRFVHLSFAEYFLAIHISENVDNVDIQNRIVQLLYDDNFKVTRKFLNKLPKFLEWMDVNSMEIVDKLRENNCDMENFMIMLINDELTKFVDILTERIFSNLKI